MPAACTRDLSQPINVLAKVMHMHMHCQKMYTEIHRADGSSKIAGVRIDHWDNGFQQARNPPHARSGRKPFTPRHSVVFYPPEHSECPGENTLGIHPRVDPGYSVPLGTAAPR